MAFDKVRSFKSGGSCGGVDGGVILIDVCHFYLIGHCDRSALNVLPVQLSPLQPCAQLQVQFIKSSVPPFIQLK